MFELIEKSDKPLGAWNNDAIVQAMAPKLSPAHTPIPNEIVPNVAFSLLTTVQDYSVFLARLSTPRGETFDLKSAMRTEMMKPYSRINSSLSWGLGWGIEQEAGRSYLWQWGDNGGWKNLVLVHPESRSAIVVFTNGSNGMRVVERIVRAASGQDQPVFLWV
ncbi:MAG TPA: hypothetical protein VIX90_05960 [Edaphobacter sp.]